MTPAGYGYVRDVPPTFSDAVSKAEAALKKEGFGVLCQIDIQSKLKEKLGVDFPRYVTPRHKIGYTALRYTAE